VTKGIEMDLEDIVSNVRLTDSEPATPKEISSPETSNWNEKPPYPKSTCEDAAKKVNEQKCIEVERMPLESWYRHCT